VLSEGHPPPHGCRERTRGADHVRRDRRRAWRSPGVGTFGPVGVRPLAIRSSQASPGGDGPGPGVLPVQHHHI